MAKTFIKDQIISHVRAIIQSRLTSTRLPAKALLPVAGIPAVVLCAKRAANTGIDVIVATSTSSADNPIVDALTLANVPVIRGPLDDVLTRFKLATDDLPAQSVIVRLTADNMFPDGNFVAEIAYRLLEEGLKYLGTHSPFDNLPYGMSAEVFTVEVLREACSSATTVYDREYVTPWIKRKYGEALFIPRRVENSKPFGHLRATLDTLHDYLGLTKVFNEVKDPLRHSWFELCEKLSAIAESNGNRIPYRLVNGKMHSELTLGTAQLGMLYGVTNFSGQSSIAEAIHIVKEAVTCGVNSIDCARAYGNSESVVGKALESGLSEQTSVITKLDIAQDEIFFTSEKALIAAVESSVFRSCRELRVQQLHTLLLHRWKQHFLCNSAAWHRLVKLKNEGVIKNLGVSVYTPEEVIEALNDPLVVHVQIPFNILDWRWKKAGIDVLFKSRSDIIVHARSVFLQGLLANSSRYWPKMRNKSAKFWLDKLDRLVDRFGLKSRADMCISYVRSQPWITSIVVGVETVQQLSENIQLFNNRILTEEECEICETELKGATEELLNPLNWRKC